MKLKQLSLAVASLIGAGFAGQAVAMDLYVDTKTQQIFAEPGPGRTKLGSFEKVEEGAARKAEIAQIKEELALKNNEIKALDEHIKDPTEGKLHVDEKGVRWASKDGKIEMALNGRMQIDGMSSTNDTKTQLGDQSTNALNDGTTIRRARLGVEGFYDKDFGYKFEYDFTRGNGTAAGGVTDAFVDYRGFAEPLTIKLGQYKEPFSLEEATSNRWLTFIERNMAVNTFSDNMNAYKVGAGFQWAEPRYTLSAAFNTESVGAGGTPTSDTTSTNQNGNANRNGGSTSTGFGFVGRATALPWFQDKNHFLHVGGSGGQRYVNWTNASNCAANNTLTSPDASTSGNSGNVCGTVFGSALDNNVDRQLILNTGNLQTNGHIAKTYERFGGESAVVYGPLSAQAEYIQTRINGNGYNGDVLDGAYGYVSYFLTGESRSYKTKTAAWDRIKPNQNFSTRGGLGAWEVAAGYDYLNLNSTNIHGGKADSLKGGINWYPMSHVRVMANYIHYLDINATAKTGSQVGLSSTSPFNGQHMDVMEGRVQVDF